MDVLVEFEKSFLSLRKELGFKATLPELDDLFYIKDHISKEGYVSSQLERIICQRITEILMGYANYLHNLLLPNPSSMVMMIESQAFNDVERQDISLLFNHLMDHLSTNSINSIAKDKQGDSRFIDDSVRISLEIRPRFIEITKKVKGIWSQRTDVSDDSKSGII